LVVGLVALTRAVAGGLVAFCCCGPLPAGQSSTAAGPSSPAGALALAERALSGTYEATYNVSGQLAVFPGPRWSIVVAHRGPAPPTGSPGNDGNWSFFLHAGSGYQLQWVEDGEHFVDCWTMRARPGWHCGQGTYQTSIGFSLAVLPYIPLTVLSGLRTALGAGPRPAQKVTVAGRKGGPRFGPLACVSIVAEAPTVFPGHISARRAFVTTCLTTQGLPASQIQWGEGTWDRLVLVRFRAPPPASDFRPVSPPGASSALPPL
jgi:hypothetical protein